MQTDPLPAVALYDAALTRLSGQEIPGARPHLEAAARTGAAARIETTAGGITHELEITPLPGADGEPAHLVCVRRDVTAVRLAEERATQLRAFTMRLAASLSEEEIGRTIIEPIHDALGATVSVAYLCEDDGALRLVASRGLSPEADALHRHLRADSPLPLAVAIRDREPVWAEDPDAVLAAFPSLLRQEVPAEALQAFAVVPARVDGRTLGGIGFSFAAPQRFDAAMREFLVAVATQYALAAERARLFGIERRARVRLAVLAEASGAFSAARLDLCAVLGSVCREIATRIPDTCAIHLVGPDGTMALAALHDPDPVSEASIRATLASRPVCVGDSSAPGRVAASGEPVFLPAVRPLAGLVVVALRTAERVIGALSATRAAGPPFSREDVVLLQELADRAALSIENARLYQEAAAARERAEAASRAKDEFLALLGHELRNPLAPILSAAHLLRVRPGDAAARDVIERQSRHMARLIDDLLDVSRITSRKLTLRRDPVELAEVLDRAIEVSRPLLDEHGVRLVVDVPAEGCRVDGDADRLTQVFANLLANAAQYGSGGPFVELTARVEEDPVLGGPAVVAEVRDEGVGIEPDLLPRLFELFTQGRSGSASRAGLGLGLAIVRSLVEMHGGRVEAQSAGRGRGSTFTVRLPAASAPAIAGAGPPPRAPGPRRDVLVVDDNRDAANGLAQLLAFDGHQVRVAYDATTALSLVAERCPEVAVLDIGLPDLDGWELGRRLGELPAPPRLVALSGFGQPSDVERSRAAGFERHLVKPLDPDLLDGLIADLA